jgi:transcriptional regulator with XRE-family HTH domain
MNKPDTFLGSEITYQKKLFHQIKNVLPSHLSLAEEIADILGISTDSAYRRLRSETPVSLEEAAALCKHFKISLEEIIPQPEEAVTFRRFSIHEKALTFADYLIYSRDYFEKWRSQKNSKCLYAAKDIPVFYYFMFPAIGKFKLFFWLKTIKGVPDFKNLPFSFDNIPDQYMKLSYAISDSYFQTPGVEIWNEETTNSTIRQIYYYYESGLFADNTIPLALIDQLEELIRHVQKQAETGQKFFGGASPVPTSAKFELYYNEVLLLDNTILHQTDSLHSVLISYNAIDYLTTTNHAFCNEVLRWLQIQMEKSVLISKTSEKERSRFFNKIYENIKQLRKKII